jgi:Uma2 family endonuclease
MATIDESKPRTLEPEQRVVLCGIGWEGYETVLRLVDDRCRVRLTYDRGDLEIISPSLEHEEYGELLGLLIMFVTGELHIPCRMAGSTTWRKQIKDKGLEPDKCFYLASFPRVRGKKTIDLDVDPPPDLAIEVEISRSALDRMGIYAAIGVPEVWRWDVEALHVAQLQADGTYAEVPVSPSLPFLPPDEVVRWLRLAEEIEDHSEWGRRLREWVRDELAPRFEGR